MRKLWIMLIGLMAAATFFYNTNWFQSFFMYDQFYNEIYNDHFDVTKVDSSITIPIKYKYKTCYSLAIAVPDSKLAHTGNVGTGVIGYKFTSGGRVIAKGLTHNPSKRNLSLHRGVTLINILVFDLPFPGALNDLSLELTVKEPMSFLRQYASNITCIITPDYSAKAGRCYNESLMISY